MSHALMAPLRVPVFRALWIATVVSNLGTLMQGVASAWLMTSMTRSPFLVGLVPAAMMLPFLAVGLVGGALADLLPRRRILIVTQSCMMAAAFLLGVLDATGRMSPAILLALTFATGFAAAVNLPAWQSQIQDIVPAEQVAAAVSLNAISFNVARAVGPALGGMVVASFGPAPVFFLNAVSFLGTVVVLAVWKPPAFRASAAGLLGAMRAGFRYVLSDGPMRSPLIRVTLLAFGGSAVWAVLPLLARDVLGLGAAGYGSMLGAFGAGSMIAASLVPGLRRRSHPDRIVAVGMCVLGGMSLCLAFVRSYPVLLAGMAFGGAAWVASLVQFNVSVQTSVPAVMRGRAMSFYLVAFQGSMGAGSAILGWLAGRIGIPAVLVFSGILVLAGLGLVRFLPLPSAVEGSHPAPGGRG